MELTILEPAPTGLRAGYSCPCGCTPSVAYERGGDIVDEGRCCGNDFAVGPEASSSLTPVSGFRLEFHDDPGHYLDPGLRPVDVRLVPDGR